LSVVKTAAVLLRHGFIVGRGCGQGAGDGVDHYLKQVTNGGKLTGIELIEQLVGMLFVHMLSLLTAKGRRRAAATSVLFPIIRLCRSFPRGEISWNYDSFQYVGSRTLREVGGRYLAPDSARATNPAGGYGISRPDAANCRAAPINRSFAKGIGRQCSSWSLPAVQVKIAGDKITSGTTASVRSCIMSQ
jgi:hypothetical protein